MISFVACSCVLTYGSHAACLARKCARAFFPLWPPPPCFQKSRASILPTPSDRRDRFPTARASRDSPVSSRRTNSRTEFEQFEAQYQKKKCGTRCSGPGERRKETRTGFHEIGPRAWAIRAMSTNSAGAICGSTPVARGHPCATSHRSLPARGTFASSCLSSFEFRQRENGLSLNYGRFCVAALAGPALLQSLE